MQPVILTSTGRYFSFVNPDPNSICIEDIATGLSRICRFTGHTRSFYSVAQHSVLVSHLVPSEHALAGLLHDASEAYLGDVSSPLKQLLPEYRELERKVEQAIATRFGLTLPLHPSVKKVDLQMLVTERRDLMPRPVPECAQIDAEAWAWVEAAAHPIGWVINAMSSGLACDTFLARFHELTSAPAA